MPRVYIETTIPSFYFETRTATKIVAWRQITREWWTRHRRRYDLVTSALVLDELSLAAGGMATALRRYAILSTAIAFRLGRTPRVAG